MIYFLIFFTKCFTQFRMSDEKKKAGRPRKYATEAEKKEAMDQYNNSEKAKEARRKYIAKRQLSKSIRNAIQNKRKFTTELLKEAVKVEEYRTLMLQLLTEKIK